jgi:hypothetical protein
MLEGTEGNALRRKRGLGIKLFSNTRPKDRPGSPQLPPFPPLVLLHKKLRQCFNDVSVEESGHVPLSGCNVTDHIGNWQVGENFRETPTCRISSSEFLADLRPSFVFDRRTISV